MTCLVLINLEVHLLLISEMYDNNQCHYVRNRNFELVKHQMQFQI